MTFKVFFYKLKFQIKIVSGLWWKYENMPKSICFRTINFYFRTVPIEFDFSQKPYFKISQCTFNQQIYSAPKRGKITLGSQ